MHRKPRGERKRPAKMPRKVDAELSGDNRTGLV